MTKKSDSQTDGKKATTELTAKQRKEWLRVSKPIKTADFLNTIFEGFKEGETPTFTSAKMIHPEDSPPRMIFITQRLLPRSALSRATHFAPVSFKADQADENGRIRKKTEHVVAAFGFVQDDVGEKANRLPGVRPSWIMKTKPGSAQYGYVFAKPVYDLEAFGDFIYSLGVEGFTDPGATKITQVFRLPGSQPPGKIYPAKLIVWSPHIKHTMKKITKTVKLNLHQRGIREGKIIDPLDPGTRVDCKLTGWVFRQPWFGMGDESGSNGYQPIQCPWHETHTDGRVGAGYHQPTPKEPWHKFSCFHGHCFERTTTDFIDWCVEQGGPRVPVRYKEPMGDLADLFPFLGDPKKFFDPTRSEVAQKVALTDDDSPMYQRIFDAVLVPAPSGQHRVPRSTPCRKSSFARRRQ